MEALIQLKDVEKIYNIGDLKVTALRKVNLEINKNDFVAILGPSGAGKSTIVNMIGCLDIPTNGKIYLKGQDIAQLSESELAFIRARTTGFVFQSFNLIPTLTAIENVLLPSIFTNKHKFKKERARELLTKVELSHRTGHKPNQLSGGEKQRVAIARSLINDPEIIITDEPTGNLDSKTGKEIMDLFTELHKKDKKTIVIVTHDMELAKIAKRRIYIKDGQVIKN